MDRRWTSLREEPDLFWKAISIDFEATAAGFVQHDEIGHLADPQRLMRLWPQCFLVLMEGERAIARAVMVPFSSSNRPPLPRTGWDGALLWAIQDAIDGIEPDTACALEINVDPSLRGQGLSGEAVAAMRNAARAHGFERLVAPVRPPDKANEPETSMMDYAARTRSDGLPEDRWLRVHARAGGRIEAIAEASMVVIGTVAEWQDWVSNPATDWSAPAVNVGGLVPVTQLAGQGLAVYVEPNVWVVHDLIE